MAKRGLGSPNMDPAVKKAIAAAGGQAVQRKGTGHRFTSDSGARAADIAHLNRLRRSSMDDALTFRCPACHQTRQPQLRLATIAVCGHCHTVLAVSAKGVVRYAQSADTAKLTPSELAAIVRAKSAVVAARAGYRSH